MADPLPSGDYAEIVQQINATGGLKTAQDVETLFKTKLTDDQVDDVIARLSTEINNLRERRTTLTAVTDIVLRTIRVASLA